MKHLFFIGLIFALIFNGCDTINKEIQYSEVTMDTITHVWTFNENGKLVTGTVISEGSLDDGTHYIRKRVIKQGLTQKLSGYYKDDKLFFETECVEGMLEGETKWYYPSGKIKQSGSYIKDKAEGLFRAYYEDGKVAWEEHYKDGLRHGTSKRYYNGLQVKEWVFEMGKEIKSYDFDDNGRKIIPPTEYMELVNHTTGFYLNEGSERYAPAVIMKWKNISDQSVNNVKFECIFFDDDDKEELDKRTDYFSIQPGVTKQLYLQSGYSWHPTRFYYGDPINISCKIFIDGKLYKTIKIKQKSLVSTRM